jgi:hypothetical protein
MMSNNHEEAEAHFSVTYDDGGPIDRNATSWLGLIENCDVCSRPMRAERYMIDGPADATRRQWGNLCVTCATKYCPEIGWGKAQLYKREGPEWYLIAGGPLPEADHELL